MSYLQPNEPEPNPLTAILPTPLPGQHLWWTNVPVPIQIIQNEDGKFAGKGPQMISLGGLQVDASKIYCSRCSQPLIEVWGKYCAEQSTEPI